MQYRQKPSTKTCIITCATGNEIGRIQFIQNPVFKTWRIAYLSRELPIRSDALPAEIKEILLDRGWSWRWH